MRLADVVVLLVLLGILFTGGMNCARTIQKYNEEITVYRRKASADYFIAESFRKTCRGEGFENLNKWQSCCRAMWNLEYIAWADASDFMIVDYDLNDKILMYGEWDGKETSGEVYCRRKVNE